jgi:hypothetical protein
MYPHLFSSGFAQRAFSACSWPVDSALDLLQRFPAACDAAKIPAGEVLIARV